MRMSARYTGRYFRPPNAESCSSGARPIRGRLAEIIVLDQFSRNIHRGIATAFESDAQALALAQEAVRDETRFELAPDEKAFLYMPFMHSESSVIQEEGLRLFSEVGLESHLAYEEEHRRACDARRDSHGDHGAEAPGCEGAPGTGGGASGGV
jgi:uncharacterized protein (DUF924 family)